MFDFRKTVSFHCLSFCIWHLCFGLIISLILETAPATAAEFDILPPEKQIHFKYKTLEELHIITLSGDIKAGDYDKLKRSVDNIKNDHEFIYNKIQISLNSPGGSFKEAVEIAQYLNEQGIRTYVGAGKRCLSACAIIFMAGTLADGDGMRDPGRYMHHTAQLGFHAPYVYGVNPKLTPEVVPHIVPDAERGASGLSGTKESEF